MAAKVKANRLALGVDPSDARRALTAFRRANGRQAGSWIEAFRWLVETATEAKKGKVR